MIGTIPTAAVGLPGLAALMLGFFAFLVALLLARHRAALAPEVRVARKATASWIWIAVQGISLAVVGFGPLRVRLDPLSPFALVQGATVGVLVAGAVWLFDASSRAMGKNWSLVARTREDHQLVDTGPFAVIRHPIYVAILLLMVGMAIAYGHLINLLVAIPVYAVATWLRVRHEECLLREQFGSAYEAYASRVKRFIPGVL